MIVNVSKIVSINYLYEILLVYKYFLLIIKFQMLYCSKTLLENNLFWIIRSRFHLINVNENNAWQRNSYFYKHKVMHIQVCKKYSQ